MKLEGKEVFEKNQAMHLKGWMYVGSVLLYGEVAPRGIGLPTLGKCFRAS